MLRRSGDRDSTYERRGGLAYHKSFEVPLQKTDILQDVGLILLGRFYNPKNSRAARCVEARCGSSKCHGFGL